MASRGAWARIAAWGFFGLVASGCLLGRVAFTPDGKRFAAVVQGDPDERDGAAAAPEKRDAPSELWVTDLESGADVRVLRDGFVGVSPAWTPDGRELWFLHGPKTKSLSLARWDGKSVADVAAMPLTDDGAVFALVPPQPCPDGKSFVVTEASEGRLARIVRCEAASGEKTVLADSAGGGVLSPKGDRLAFLAWEGAQPRPLKLCLMPLDGKPRVTVATLRDKLNDITGVPVAWSPSGARIAWEDQPEDPDAATDAHAVYLADAETLAVTRVSPAGETGRLPVFSADGAHVYYTRWLTKDGPTVVRRADVAGGAVKDVPGSEGSVAAGVSPDGRFLAMQRAIGPKDGPASGATVVRLLDIASGEARDVWVSAYQLRTWAATSLTAAAAALREQRAADGAAALARADEALELMARRFPGSEKHPAAVRTRNEVDDLRAVK